MAKITPSGSYWSNASQPNTLKYWQLRARIKILFWKLAIRGLESLKRTLDIILSFSLLAAASPLLLIACLLIKREDGGPLIFKQQRVGKSGKPFILYKFRSMVLDAEAQKAHLESQNIQKSGVTFKIKNDPRLTKVGKWIRKFSIDEFPQLFNVLKGDMALVGPRPPVLEEVLKYKPIHLRRLLVKPGITCLWQIGGRNFLDFEDQVRLDLKYIHSRGILNDLKILLKTIPAVLFGRGAY